MRPNMSLPLNVSPLFQATVLLFWSLYMIEPTLVIPKWAEPIIPKWHNHMTVSVYRWCEASDGRVYRSNSLQHTAPVPFLLVDTLLMCHHMPPRKTGSLTVIALIIFYFGMYYISDANRCRKHQSSSFQNRSCEDNRRLLALPRVRCVDSFATWISDGRRRRRLLAVVHARGHYQHDALGYDLNHHFFLDLQILFHFF